MFSARQTGLPRSRPCGRRASWFLFLRRTRCGSRLPPARALSDTARGAKLKSRRPARGGNYIRAAAPINPAFRGSPSKCGSCCQANGDTLSARRHRTVGAGTAHCQAASCAAGCRLLNQKVLRAEQHRRQNAGQSCCAFLLHTAQVELPRASAGKQDRTDVLGRAPAKRRRRSDRQSLLRSGSALASSACGSFCRR